MSASIQLTTDRDRSKTNGRVLVISYHFGLDGATGGFRWASTTNGLVELGWQVDVITAATSAPRVSVSELVSVPPVTWPTTVSSAILQGPRSVVRWLRHLRGRTSGRPPIAAQSSPLASTRALPESGRAADDIEMPDGSLSLASRMSRLVDDVVTLFANRLWSRRAQREGFRLARRHTYAAVVVSSPPHEHHLAGLALGRALGIPCVADFRDPWVLGLPPGFAGTSAVYDRLATWLEARIQRDASVVVHNTDRVREVISALPGSAAQRRESIPNGYDDRAIDDHPPVRDTFDILFAGHIYPFMDVRVLLRAVRTFYRDPGVDQQRVRLVFLGTLPTLWERPFTDILAHYGLGDCAQVRARVSRSEALAVQRRAAVQVVFDYPHPLSVPMKFYDYLQSGGELLLFSRPGSALAAAAAKVGRTVVEPEDAAGAVAVLRGAYATWERGAFPRHQDPGGVHHRRARIAEVDSLLRQLTGTTKS